MHVPVDNKHTLKPPLMDGPVSSDGDVVVDAEPHRQMRLGVVAWRTLMPSNAARARFPATQHARISEETVCIGRGLFSVSVSDTNSFNDRQPLQNYARQHAVVARHSGMYGQLSQTLSKTEVWATHNLLRRVTA